MVASVGRCLIALVFLGQGFSQLFNFNAHLVNMQQVAGLPPSSLLLGIAILINLAGGLLLTVGWRVAEVAVVLIALRVISMSLFWKSQPETWFYLRDLGVIGGLLLAASYEKLRVAARREIGVAPPLASGAAAGPVAPSAEPALRRTG